MTTTAGSCTAIISIAAASSASAHRAHLAARYTGRDRGPQETGSGGHLAVQILRHTAST